jgi:hypothetical protein
LRKRHSHGSALLVRNADLSVMLMITPGFIWQLYAVRAFLPAVTLHVGGEIAC